MNSNTSRSISSTLQAIVARLWKLLVWGGKLIFRWSWAILKRVASYYWNRRLALWRHFTEYVRDFRSESLTNREIRISSDDRFDNVDWDGEQWEVRMPACCVVCGDPTDRPAIRDIFDVERLTLPFWAPIVAVASGLIMILPLWGYPRWVFPIWVFAGFLIGYNRHEITKVDLSLRRCKKHAQNTKFPQLRAFGDDLIIGVGNKAVKLAFRKERRKLFGNRGGVFDESVDSDDPYAVPASSRSEAPEPIPLADDVQNSVEPEEGTPLDSPGSSDSDAPLQ